MIPVQLIVIGVLTISAASTTWFFQENRYERIIAEQRAAQSALLAEAYANAKRETERMAQAKDDALKQAAIRQAGLARDLAANRAGLVGLSDATDSALRGASDSLGACHANANTLTVVFGQCAVRLSDVAEQADGWHSEAMTLREAWPQ